ncbi:MAG: hypothetical protein WC285_01965 [Candidatus Gracilibacteria bacterium]|jgi:hypothetical protein
MERKICKNCATQFIVTDSDEEFLNKISPTYNGKKYLIPIPTFCPDCRQQRRISWRNERSLYQRKCSKTGKKIIAMYPESAVFPVYDNDIWWGDGWDGRDYGQEINFNKSFFEQIKELHDRVPHFALAVAKTTMQNSDYCNHAGYMKDCYLVYNTDYSERCMYSKGVNRCFDCLDCLKVYDSEACYECMNSYNCKFCTYVWDSYNSSESHLSYNLIGCRNCFLCGNLRNQEYCFQNEKLPKEEWQKKVNEFKLKQDQGDFLRMVLRIKLNAPAKFMTENNTENCTGDYLVNCKNCEECYDCEYLENSKHCYDLKKGDGISYENQDLSAFGVGVVQCYEGGTVGYNDNHCLFGENVWESFDVHYSMLCVNNCKNCFGCIGLQKAQYCILNKQYSKEEYERNVSRIIENMKQAGEWGEFFPTNMSPFGYNETMAQEYYPMTEQEVVAKGWKWKEEDKKEYQKQTYKAPANIKEIDNSICNEILACQNTGRNFKIQSLELEFYKKMNLPIPKYCPDERHLQRLQCKNPRRLSDRNCKKCGTKMKTTYGETIQNKVYCCKCYLETIM